MTTPVVSLPLTAEAQQRMRWRPYRAAARQIVQIHAFPDRIRVDKAVQ